LFSVSLDILTIRPELRELATIPSMDTSPYRSDWTDHFRTALGPPRTERSIFRTLRAEEKRAVLALLPRFPTPEALDQVNRAAADPDVAVEAKAAAALLERTVRR
jgi:hypothetical protein